MNLRPVQLLAALLLAALAATMAQAHDLQGPSVLTNLDQHATAIISGTVDDLIIDDQVNSKTLHVYTLRADDGSLVPLSGAGEELLQDGARVEIRGQRNGAQFAIEDVQPLAGSDGGGGPTIAAQVVGTLMIAHSDDFAGGNSRYFYQVQDDSGGVTTLSITSLPSSLHTGMQISVTGQPGTDPATLYPQYITILAAPAVAPAATVNSILVILANFSDTAAPAFTPAQAQQVMTSNATSVGNYYDEVSYGQQTLNVTVTSTWLTMNMSYAVANPTCDWYDLGTAAQAAASSAGYNPASYHDVVYVFPSMSTCGWAGLAWVGAPGSWINGTQYFYTQVVAHEMGHNFGLLHSGSLACGSAIIGGSCTAAEYGDPFDTMGNQHAMHFNAAQKALLNWINPTTQVATHTGGTKSYTLSPIESPGGSLYAVTIPTSNADRTYWIEFRQPVGFDSPSSAGFSFPNLGAQIRVASPFEVVSGADNTELLDMTTSTPGNFVDAALLVGQSFVDSATGVTVLVNSATSSALNVTVSVAGGSATTTTVTSSANPSTLGASITFRAAVTGSTPTGTVGFAAAGSAIAGCSAVALTASGGGQKHGTATYTATCTTNALGVGEHSIVATYSGDSNNAISKSVPLTQTVNKATTATGIATSLTPSVVGASVTFTATVSGDAPTGKVNFLDGATSVGACSAVTLSGSGNIRTAKCTTSALTAGTHSMTAAYGGDASNTASTSVVLAQVVRASGGGGHHH